MPKHNKINKWWNFLSNLFNFPIFGTCASTFMADRLNKGGIRGSVANKKMQGEVQNGLEFEFSHANKE